MDHVNINLINKSIFSTSITFVEMIHLTKFQELYTKIQSNLFDSEKIKLI